MSRTGVKTPDNGYYRNSLHHRPALPNRQINLVLLTHKLHQQLVQMLVQDNPLPDKYQDHDLIGNWKGFKECHLKPDLLLIYRQIDDELQLARLGSHNELFK